MNGRVLLIDDDRFARRVYGDHLEDAGFEVVTAATGEAGIELLRGEHFDVVVTDMLLPGLDGQGVLAEARRIDPEVGVVVITALDMVDPAVRAIKSGAFDYLVKPVSAEALATSVQRCLDYLGLLRQNADLARNLALAEAGSSIGAASGREDVYRLTAETLVARTGARLALVVARRPPAAPRLLCAAGAGLPDPWTFEVSVDEALGRLLEGAAIAELPPPAALGTRLGPGVAMTLQRRGGEITAALAFADDGAVLEQSDRWALSFLAGQGASSLETLGRLDHAERLAFKDDVTELGNARYLSRILDGHLRADPASPFAVLFIDLDRFKDVNDTHGHVVGSELLGEVGRVVKGAIRDADVAVRYGGDEYIVVLPETGPEAAMHVAERIRSRIESHAFLARESKRLRITASVGVACFPDHATEKKVLIALADEAMYQGKRADRNSVYLATRRST